MTTAPPGKLGPADQQLLDGVLAGQRRALAKTITLIESTRIDHQQRARQVLNGLLPHTGSTMRVGISGSPGAGKSTFIESLGLHLIDAGKRVAVLAVDPSSSVSGGSILGDKTREAMLVCEAAGFDVIIVETVGVGQSETTVAGMVDVFVLLQLPNAGDDLQAIKKGIVEIADLIVFNKADIDEKAAAFARNQMRAALTMLRSASPHWRPPVLTISALAKRGIAEFWTEIERYRQTMQDSGEFDQKRRRQAVDWMWNLIDSSLRQDFRSHPSVRAALPTLSKDVAEGKTMPGVAAAQLLAFMKQ